MVQEIIILYGYPWKGGSEKGLRKSFVVFASDVVGITYLPSKYSRSKARTKLELLELQLVAIVEISTVSYSYDEIGLRVDRGLEHQSGTSSFEDMYSLHLVMALGSGGELFDRTIARGYSLENDAVDNFGQLPILVLNCHFMVVMHKNLKSEKPSLWFNSTAYFPRDFVLFDIHIVFDGCWNQLLIGHPRILCPRHQLGLAQCLEEQFWLHQFSPDELGLDFPFDPGSAALIRVQSPQRTLEDHSTLSYPSRQYVFKLSEYLADDLLRLLKCIDYHGLSIHMVNKFVMPVTHQSRKHEGVFIYMSWFSLDFFMSIMIDKYVYVKVSWLNNGRRILDDKRDTVLGSSVPPTTVYCASHEMLLGAFESVRSSKLALALSPADGKPSIRRGAIRRLCFAYVSAPNEHIFGNSTLMLRVVLTASTARFLELICGCSCNRKFAPHTIIAWIHQNGSKLEKPLDCLLPFDLEDPYVGQHGRANVTHKASKIIAATTTMLQERTLGDWITLALGSQINTKLVLLKYCYILLGFFSQAVDGGDPRVIGLDTHLFIDTHLFMSPELTLIQQVQAEMILVAFICRTIFILLFIPMFVWPMKYSKGTQDLSHHDLGQNEVYYAVTIVVPGMSRAWYCALNSAQEEFAGACHPVNFTSIEVNITTASLPKPLISRILDPNLEDKVLIEEGSIVVNMDNSNNAYGPIIWTEASQVVGPRLNCEKAKELDSPTRDLLGIQVE